MAETTIVPFANLPGCASSCGPLYDVNGACVPPAAPTAAAAVYDACFCSDARLTVFSSTTAGVCDAACTADPAGYDAITSWYQSLCTNPGQVAAIPTTTVSSGSGASSETPSSNPSSGGGGGTWISNHWRWVIFIVVMVVGIAGIWTGAALWRRNYLRKKDRQYALGKTLAQRTGSGQNPYDGQGSGTSNRSLGSTQPAPPGMFMSSSTPESGLSGSEKPAKTKKKWLVAEKK